MRRTTSRMVGSLFFMWALGSGCSSTSGGGGFSPGGGDGGTQGDGGVAPGDDGSASALDGPGRGPDGAGVDAAAVDAACTAAGTTLCTKLNTCFPFVVETLYGDEMRCRNRYGLQCVAQLSAPGTGVTPTFIEACDTAIAAGTCADLLDGVLPSACQPLPVGQLAAGAACGESGQCAGGDCRKPTGSYCGSCTSLAASGASCASADCEPGLKCVPSNKVCTPLGALNATCDATHPCEATLVCIRAGKCVARAALGATCVPTRSTCDDLAGQACDPVTKKCVQAQLTSTTCGIVNGALMACKGGAACKFPSQTSATGTCVAPAADGAACNTTSGPSCLPPAYCNAGTCTHPDASVCH